MMSGCGRWRRLMSAHLDELVGDVDCPSLYRVENKICHPVGKFESSYHVLEAGCHTTTVARGPSCACPSVVECADVLPHLYVNGFSFKDAFTLKRMTYDGNKSEYKQTAASKRQCYAFATQLQAVLSPDAPLNTLLTTIDDFLFLFRYYFLGNLSTFWSIYIGIILYTFFFLLDTLHLRSHLKLTSSHTVPLLALLTTGKARALTKLTYITQ
ncbi:extracellular matrix-binding ebh, putative [Babesia caballi]|uniref:Extracellular matrix-binding ebh, putative n=1 Tax=Babesia caballi TaxID=5871 RepID=A0AAV4LWY4_BABCB|nr:extracellular matrix-binding ebh, putative [Babesia caballi]